MEPNKSDKLAGTVVIADFSERRGREPVRDDVGPMELLEPGTKVGRYLIVEKLGGGGMGVVYKAQDTELQRTVALKVLPPHLCRHPEYLNRFRAEAQAQARLNSPFVVMLYSLLELPVGEILVLEYSEGQTLEQRLKSGGPLSTEEAVRIFEQALRGIEHIHSKSVVHRDLKPANIFLTRDGRVKLMDFGVAKVMDQPEQNAARTMVGTLLYISPEQINGHSTDFRSDIYTLGVSLFESVTGRLPFERRTDYALMHAHATERPPRPTEIQRRVPVVLETVILKAIEKDPDRRFQSAPEFRKSLLKLGFYERRRAAGQKRSAATAKVDTPASTRLLGGLWLDTALVCLVAGLLYALDIYPIKQPTPTMRTAVATTAAPVAKKPAATVMKRTTGVPSAQRAPANSSSSPKSPPDNSADKYNSLREAWGNNL